MARSIITANIVYLLSVSIFSFSQQTAQFADSLRKSNHIPELSYAVVNAKDVLEIASMGVHSIALPDTATLDDRFHIGSNTKALTAFIIAKYVEMGKLQWGTKFFSIFPKWKKKSNKAYNDITLKDLLSHRAGIQPFQGENDPVIPDFKGTKQEKRKAFGKYVLRLAPVEKNTNTQFVYSNADYTLAALMLEKVTEKSWEQLVYKVFNTDLHLNVKLSWPENQKVKDTWGHLSENNQLIPLPSNTNIHSADFTEPAGDINITLRDYVKFIQMNLSGLTGINNYLKASTYTFIHKGTGGYSLGWYNIYENNKEYSTHAGTAGTYYTLATMDRRNYTGFIIFTNSFNVETTNAARLLMRRLKETYGS